MAAVNTKVVFVQRDAGQTGTLVLGSIGFTPAAVFTLSRRRASNNSIGVGQGVASTNNDHWSAWSMYYEDETGTSRCRTSNQDRIINLLSDPSAGPREEVLANISAVGADSITLDYTSADFDSDTYVFLTDDALALGHNNAQKNTSNPQTITMAPNGADFVPEFLSAWGNLGTIAPTNSFQFALNVGDGVNDYGGGFTVENNQSSTKLHIGSWDSVNQVGSGDARVWAHNSPFNGNVAEAATLTIPGPVNQFEMDPVVGGTFRRVRVFGYGTRGSAQSAFGREQIPATDSNPKITTGFQPDFIWVAAMPNASDEADGTLTRKDAGFSIGFWCENGGVPAVQSVAIADEDAVSSASPNAILASKIAIFLSPFTGSADVQIESDGFRLNWGALDGSQGYYTWWAFGEAGGPTALQLSGSATASAATATGTATITPPPQQQVDLSGSATASVATATGTAVITPPAGPHLLSGSATAAKATATGTATVKLRLDASGSATASVATATGTASIVLAGIEQLSGSATASVATAVGTAVITPPAPVSMTTAQGSMFRAAGNATKYDSPSLGFAPGSVWFIAKEEPDDSTIVSYAVGVGTADVEAGQYTKSIAIDNGAGLFGARGLESKRAIALIDSEGTVKWSGTLSMEADSFSVTPDVTLEGINAFWYAVNRDLAVGVHNQNISTSLPVALPLTHVGGQFVPELAGSFVPDNDRGDANAGITLGDGVNGGYGSVFVKRNLATAGTVYRGTWNPDDDPGDADNYTNHETVLGRIEDSAALSPNGLSSLLATSKRGPSLPRDLFCFGVAGRNGAKVGLVQFRIPTTTDTIVQVRGFDFLPKFVFGAMTVGDGTPEPSGFLNDGTGGISHGMWGDTAGQEVNQAIESIQAGGGFQATEQRSFGALFNLPGPTFTGLVFLQDPINGGFDLNLQNFNTTHCVMTLLVAGIPFTETVLFATEPQVTSKALGTGGPILLREDLFAAGSAVADKAQGIGLLNVPTIFPDDGELLRVQKQVREVRVVAEGNKMRRNTRG